MTAELKLDGFNKLLRAMKVKPPTIEVGILDDPEEATIGAAHEFGTSTLPQRSFLRVPLSENLGKKLEASGVFTKAHIAKVVREGSLTTYADIISDIALGVVLNAFDTAGNGRWPPAEHATGHPLLVDSGRLRDSVRVEVKF